MRSFMTRTVYSFPSVYKDWLPQETARLRVGMRNAKAMVMETTMAAEQRKPWNTPDFERRFKEAMGRNMTRQEREFFGLDSEDSNGQEKPETQPTSDRAKYAWQALRRISSLIG